MTLQTWIAAYAAWLVRRRLWVLAGTVLAVVLLASFASRLAFDANYRIWFEEDDPYLVSYDRFIREFGNDDMIAVAFKDEAGILRPAPVETVQRLTEQFWQLTGVIRVDSLTNFQAVRGAADGIDVNELFPADEPVTEERLVAAATYLDQDPLLVGSLITPDRRVAMIRAKFAPTAIDPGLPAKIYGELTAVLAEEEARSGYHFYMAGGPLTDQAFDLVAQRDMGTLVPLVLGVMIVLLGVLFRSFWGVGVTIGTALLAIAATLGLTGAFGFKLNTITVAIPHLLTGIAVATTLHVFSSFLTAKARGLGSREAVQASLATNLVPIVLTSVTTAIGFFGFLFATIVPVTRLGFMAGLGTLVVAVLALTAVPALLSFYPERPRRSLDRFLGARRRLHGFGQWVVRHARPIILVWTGVGLVAIAGLPLAAVDSNPVGYFKPHYWFSQSVNFLEEQGSGGAVYEIAVRGKGPESVKSVSYMADLDRLSRYLLTEAPGEYANVYSLSTVLRNINRALHDDDPAFHVLPTSDEAIAQYLLLYTLSVPVGQDINDRINVDYSASRLTVIRALTPTQESRRNIDAISAWAADNLRNVSIEFTGRDVLYTNMGNNVSTSLLRSLAFTITLVTLVITVLFRSVRIGLVSLIPNALPLVLILGLMGLGGILLDVGTIMVASIGFGIAVDDTIHFLTHYRAERNSGSDTGAAVAATLERIGIPISATTLVLATAFLVFLMADFMPNFYFGLLLSLLLVFALAADLTLTPSMLHWLESRKARSATPDQSAPECQPLEVRTLPTLQGESR